MDHTHIIQAGNLDRYAPTRDSQAVIPELIYWLVKQSCSDLVTCRIPYGDAVNQPGWDGIVETDKGFNEFVPKGRSCWEIGTGAKPQDKATADFKKRTDETDDNERANTSFVFVTPRSHASGGWNEPDQTEWLKQRKDKGWKQIRIIDGVKLADWLREYPAIGRWMAQKIGLSISTGGLSTATEHWENLVSEWPADDPALPPQLFTVGRSKACQALQALFEEETQVLKFFVESPQDAVDFVSAFLAGLPTDRSRIYSNRCLFIRDERAWRSAVETRSPHILIADPRLGLETEEGAELQTIAKSKGHAVVVPLCAPWPGNSPEILKLRSPSRSQIESVLKESGYTDLRARELGERGADRISALRRYLRGYGTLPPYAKWDNARLFAQAGLVGKWDGANHEDRSALEMLQGKQYGEWIEMLRSGTSCLDSPLIQHDEKWRLVARSEAWNALGSRITDDDLDRFQKMAVHVLSKRDPKFDLPKEDRFAASIHGKMLPHSHLIREGIAETLALIGSRPEALVSCSHRKAESTAILVVRDLLNKASWDCWASLDSILPLLAEAAPNEFLNAVESVLVDLNNTPFHRIFAEEGGGGFGGNYMSGLLWALEALAWSPELISRVSVILADISSFDPGGNWTNRPLNSLVNIYLPWHVQTVAPFEKRKSAVEAVIKEHPSIGWGLLLALLPHGQGFTSGSYRPAWRDYIPRAWERGVSRDEYWEQITAYTSLAVTLAKSDSGRLCELIKRLSDLPNSARESLLAHLNSDEVVSLSEVERLPLWEKLDELVRNHRKFSDADWALPKDMTDKIAEVTQALTPTSPPLKYRYLFSGSSIDLFEEKGNYDEQRKQLDQARQAAITEIIGEGNVDAALNFAEKVANPYEVGQALGVIASDEMEGTLLPSLLDSESDIHIRVVAGFIWTRFQKLKIDWVDVVLEKAWSPEHQLKFLTLLPFKEEIWERVSSCLTISHEALYWNNVKVNPYIPERNPTTAIEKLLEYGREGAAVMCIARTADDNSSFDESLATRALLATLKSEHGIRELDNYQTVELIKHLQKSNTADEDALFQIEWGFLPWLDRFSSGSPVTLERRLASDPGFFAEVIRLIFRSKNSSESDCEEPDEQKRNLAQKAYKLLTEWKCCPGLQDDGSFSTEAFNLWISEARKRTEESGHAEVAQIQIGHVLTCAPSDPDGLWIHSAVAETLNSRDTRVMRSGFTTQLFNNRGVHGFTHGQEERMLANKNRAKAEALDSKGYTRFATAMREFAEQYERDAEREAKRNPLED